MTRLPPVRFEKPIVIVSPMMTLTRACSIPSSSATTLAMDARLPPTSGWPVVTTTLPSSVMFTCTEDSPPALYQKPEATPRPRFTPGRGFLSSGAL